MKDATGELSMTAVAVVAIAAIALLFRSLVWPQIQKTIQRNTYCSQAFKCDTCDNKTCQCYYYNDDTGNAQRIDCPNNQKAITP